MTECPTPENDRGKARFDEVHVSAGDAGLRIDAFLAKIMPAEYSRSRIKQLIQQGNVSLNARKCTTPNTRLKVSDSIGVKTPRPEMTALVGEAIDLDIMFEDTEVIVLNKPPGLVVHPAPGNWTGTLVNALIHHCGDSLRGIGGERRPGIVHRLDQYTSGVMVVAKTQSAHAALARQFADHNCRDLMQRKYHAVAWGSFERRSGLVDAPLGRAARNRLKRSVVAKDQRDAKRAVTRYAVLARLDGNGDGVADATLVECSLETGRTHQIRVHLAHIGHPVVGDSLYGRHMQTKTNTLADPARTVASRFHRQALHAASLAFTHPKSGKMMQFEASPPSDMMRLIAAFEKLD